MHTVIEQIHYCSNTCAFSLWDVNILCEKHLWNALKILDFKTSVTDVFFFNHLVLQPSALSGKGNCIFWSCTDQKRGCKYLRTKCLRLSGIWKWKIHFSQMPGGTSVITSVFVETSMSKSSFFDPAVGAFCPKLCGKASSTCSPTKALYI